jgi:hypothetical protein
MVMAGFGFLPLLFLPKSLALVLGLVVGVVLMVALSLLVTRTIQSRWLKNARPASPPALLRPGFGTDIVSAALGIVVASVVLRSALG